MGGGGFIYSRRRRSEHHSGHDGEHGCHLVVFRMIGAQRGALAVVRRREAVEPVVHQRVAPLEGLARHVAGVGRHRAVEAVLMLEHRREALHGGVVAQPFSEPLPQQARGPRPHVVGVGRGLEPADGLGGHAAHRVVGERGERHRHGAVDAVGGLDGPSRIVVAVGHGLRDERIS